MVTPCSSKIFKSKQVVNIEARVLVNLSNSLVICNDEGGPHNLIICVFGCVKSKTSCKIPEGKISLLTSIECQNLRSKAKVQKR